MKRYGIKCVARNRSDFSTREDVYLTDRGWEAWCISGSTIISFNDINMIYVEATRWWNNLGPYKYYVEELESK